MAGHRTPRIFRKTSIDLELQGRSLLLSCGLFFFLILLPGISDAQDETGDADVVGFFSGPLLAGETPGLREIMPANGLRYSSRFFLGRFELEAFYSNAHGSYYYSGSARLRYDLDIADGFMPGLFLIGFDTFHYQKVLKVTTITILDEDTTTSDITYEPGDTASFSGVHMGFSVRPRLYGNFFGRVDMIMRFSPGSTVLVAVGGEYLF